MNLIWTGTILFIKVHIKSINIYKLIRLKHNQLSFDVCLDTGFDMYFFDLDTMNRLDWNEIS